MIPYSIIKEFVFGGIRFQYESYDHKKAVEEICQIKTAGGSVTLGIYPCQSTTNNPLLDSCWAIPDKIKKNHLVWRIGKLRQVYFNPQGEMWRFKIGNKFIKNFYLEDFGVTVKPMIFKSDDYLNLIGQGLAVEETI